MRRNEPLRGWLSLVFFPTLAGLSLWGAVHHLSDSEPITLRGGMAASPQLLLLLAGVMFSATVWIALREREKWPVGFTEGLTKRVGRALLIASFALMAISTGILAVGQARLIGW